MMPVALVTGADRGLGFGLCAGLLSGGWKVFNEDHLALIDNEGQEWPW